MHLNPTNFSSKVVESTDHIPTISLPSSSHKIINQMIITGGISFCTIIAMTIFTYVLLQGINNHHKSNVFSPKKQKKKIDFSSLLLRD